MSDQTTNPNPLAGLEMEQLSAKFQNQEIDYPTFAAEMNRRLQIQVGEAAAKAKAEAKAEAEAKASESAEAWNSWAAAHPPKGDFNYVRCSAEGCKGHDISTFPFAPEHVSSVAFKTEEDEGDTRTLVSVTLFRFKDGIQSKLAAAHLQQVVTGLLCTETQEDKVVPKAYLDVRAWKSEGRHNVTLDFQESEKSKKKESNSGSANTTTSRNRR